MKTYLLEQYFPFFAYGVYGIDYKLPSNFLEKEVESLIDEQCEEWYNKLKLLIETYFKETVKLSEFVSYNFRKLSARDLIEFPFVIKNSLYVECQLNQKFSGMKAAEFFAKIEVPEEIEQDVLDFLLENNFFYRDITGEPISSFESIESISE